MENESAFITNISGKLKNTKLPFNKSLWPLYEIISNSIHSIEEKKNIKNGLIEIEIERFGNKTAYNEIKKVDAYPIITFTIRDNGIGFTDNNHNSFLTAESEYKIEKGAKGVGRFVALKAFENVEYQSIYKNGVGYFQRKFVFKPTGNGIFEYSKNDIEKSATGTTVKLINFKEDYRNSCPKTLNELAESIVEHFLIYFIDGKCPTIKITDVNGEKIVLQDYFNSTFNSTIKKEDFSILKENFKISLLRVFDNRKTHKIYFCGNEREVKSENINKYILDFSKNFEEDERKFVYHAYVTSDYFDKNIDNERLGFIFQDNDDQDTSILSYSRIRKEVISKIEILLEPLLTSIREEKFNIYETHIKTEAPQFRVLLKYNPEAIKKLSPNLNGNKLDIELFKLQSELEIQNKELGDKVLSADEDFTSTEEYQKIYSDYLEKFNDLGKANLAKYIIHRKSVINLLDKFIGSSDGKFQTEDVIHNIFFPMRKTSDEISYEKQNLWLIDERLAYHNYLSSDKTFKSIEITESQSADRTDLLIFNESFAFINDEAPYQSFTIVEFKRPERDGYTISDSKKNPIDQVLSYIRTIRENKATDRLGKTIDFNENGTKFYAYIILDFNSSIKQILEEKDYTKTHDGMGYYNYNKNYNAYIEVVSYQKLLKDAKIRNRILFDKLGIPTN
jgi:hypothetical protein